MKSEYNYCMNVLKNRFGSTECEDVKTLTLGHYLEDESIRNKVKFWHRCFRQIFHMKYNKKSNNVFKIL